jgi:hypothetical protein
MPPQRGSRRSQTSQCDLSSKARPGESRIGLTEPSVNQSDAVRRHKRSGRELAQLGNRLVSCRRSAASSLSVSASGDGNRPTLQLVIDALKGSDRGVVLPKFLQRTPPPKVCRRKFRIHLQYGVELPDRFIVPT